MSADKRVLLVIADGSRSGGPEHVLTLASELARAGWEPLVACTEGGLAQRCRAEGLAAAELAMAGRGWLVAPVQLRQLGRRWRAAIWHSHGLRAGALARRAHPGVPLVHTHHLDGWFTASRSRIVAHRRELRALGRACSLQIAVSNSVAEFLSGEGGADPRRLRVIPNGIHPLEGNLRARPRARTAGLLARLTESKGADVAVLALGTPAGRRLRLRVGGQGPQLSALVDLAAASGVADRVDFVGEVRDRQGFLDSLDVAWVPSRAEPFGLVACEAMSAGVPVVASRVGGLVEILEPPRFGLAVNPANPAALASVTAGLLEDEERYSELSAAGPARVRQRYTAARMAALVRGVYWELLEA
ncbi:MAG: glycosyltransferase family 4 protein [Candidatus Dormibacteria bacterium]